MNPGNRPPLGFSKLEIAFILVLAALVGLLVITRFLDLSQTAKQSVDSGVVAAVRQGIAEYAQESKVRERLPIFPLLLDDADTGEVTSRNPFFTRVVKNGLAVNGWIKTGRNGYRAPNGALFHYDPETGDFVAATDETILPKPRSSQIRPPASTED